MKRWWRGILLVTTTAWLGCQAAPEPRGDGPVVALDSQPPGDHGQDRPWADGPAGDGPAGDRGSSPDTSFLPDLLPKVPYTGRFPVSTGEFTATLTVGGQARKVLLYRPSGAKPNAPLMLAFHGTHGTGRDMIKPSSVAARELADQQGLVVAAPQARKMSKGDWDNHGSGDVYWETHPSTDPAKNPDLLLVQAIIAEARRAYRIDPRRVYALGHSNGGFFAILTAVSMPNRIAGFVSNSAGLVRCATTGSCTFSGSATSCAALSGSKSYCSCTGT